MNIIEKINSGVLPLITVVGTGYVGMPLIEQFSKICPVIAYDINKKKIEKLSKNKNKNIRFTSDAVSLKMSDVIIVCVPTPIDSYNNPNLEYIKLACTTIAENLKMGALIIFESSYMPTCTEKLCIPLIEKVSGLENNKDFFIGYSPERINPGDNKNTLNTITKLIASSNDQILNAMEFIYSKMAGINVYKINDIKVAEMSKLVENCQRDINIAFMNELTKLCHKLDIDINEVISAAGTKWNFMKFYPGLVGGDCVGVNSYYLMNLAEKYGEQLNVLETARNTNLSVSKYIVEQLNEIVSKMGNNNDNNIKVTIYGYTYKENTSDIRNTRVADLYNELIKNNYLVEICDYNVSSDLEYLSVEDVDDSDIVILAVPHVKYANWDNIEITKKFDINSKYKVFIDLKSVYNKKTFPKNITYWHL